MSTKRLLRPQALRPQLSLRYQCLRRAESTAPKPTEPLYQAPLPAPKPSFLKRNRSPLIWGSLALALGLMGGNFATHIIAPPALPEAGSREDRVLMADLEKRIDEEFKVKVLRGKCLGVAKQLKGIKGGWVEIVPQSLEDTTGRDGSLLQHMRGAKGLGVERVFWDAGESKLVAVVWFGSSLSGWPGVTHGGVLATILTEKLALAAALAEGHINDVSAAARPQRMPGVGNHAKMFAPTTTPDEPAQLSLTYVKPTHANNFYVVRVSPGIGLDQDPSVVVPKETAGRHDFEATLESLDARICVKAKAEFKASSALQRAESEVADVAKRSYAELREWLWPSRQRSSRLG